MSSIAEVVAATRTIIYLGMDAHKEYNAFMSRKREREKGTRELLGQNASSRASR